jgi:hypothetical protein
MGQRVTEGGHQQTAMLPRPDSIQRLRARVQLLQRSEGCWDRPAVNALRRASDSAGEGFARRAGVPSFERSATFFEKDSGQWGALAAFALHWPPSDKGRAPSSLTHRKLMCGP